jgi:hypothetical protein
MLRRFLLVGFVLFVPARSWALEPCNIWLKDQLKDERRYEDCVKNELKKIGDEINNKKAMEELNEKFELLPQSLLPPGCNWMTDDPKDLRVRC